MKTSEQMTADVLKRRDEELKELPKKRRIKMAAIGTPCMAATAALGIVSFNFIHGANEFLSTYEGETLEDYAFMFFHGGKGKYIHGTTATPGSTDGNIELGNLQLDVATRVVDYEDQINKYLNAGKYYYHTAVLADLSTVTAKEKPAPDIEPTDFIEQTIKLTNMHFGIEFDRFGRLHPDWTETYGKLGFYVRDENDGFTASRRFLSDQCTLNYVTPDGAEISVTAQQYQKFFDDKYITAWDEADGDELTGLIPEFAPEYPEYCDAAPEYPGLDLELNTAENKPDNKSYNIYDDDGNIIGAFTPGYNPGNTGVINDNETDEVKTIIYNSFEGTEWLTYLDMGNNTWVKIHIKGIADFDDVRTLLDEYTNNPVWLDEINSLNNSYHGKYSFKFVSGESGLLSSINGVEGYPAFYEFTKPEYNFQDLTIDELSQHYWLDFDRLGRLHPDWSKTIDRPLGIYYRYESFRDGDLVADGLVAASDYNSLNYTTPDGAKILVTAQKKPFHPAGEILEDIQIGTGPFIVLDEDGNKIDELKFFNPHFSVDIPEDAENVEVEIYSDRSDPDTHLAYINMGSWVKIRAEGLSDMEFLELLKEFIK